MEGGGFLPALTVTASLCYGDRGVGSDGSGRGVCRPSCVRSCGGWRSNLIEKEMARKMDAMGNSYLCLRPLILYAVVNFEQVVNSICCNDGSCVNDTGGVLW